MDNIEELQRAIGLPEPRIVQLCGVIDGVGCSIGGVVRPVIALALYDDGTMRYVVSNGRGEERRPQVVMD